MKKISATLICVALSLSISGAENKPTFEITAPAGWMHETIPFPLGFAPEIKYQGVEELRFSPGMYKPDSNTYFSYVFVWCLDGDQQIDAGTLENNLNLYFKGLCKAVAKGRHLNLDANQITSKVTAAENDNNEQYKQIYWATINSFDPFTKGEQIKLNADIALLNTNKTDKTILIFCVSTKPYENEIWDQMRKVRSTFHLM